MSEIRVQFAVYGALARGNENESQAKSVTSILQNLINSNDGIVTINNETMNRDPSPGNGKHFGAELIRDGGTYYFACAEGQTIDFLHGGSPA